MKSVLLLTPWFPNTPGDRQGNFIYESALALSKLGFAIDVLVSRPWVPKAFEGLKVEWERDRFEPDAFHDLASVRLVRHLSVPRNHLWRFSEWSRARRVERRLLNSVREHRTQLIHAHTESMAAIAVKVGRALGIPVVVTIHGINMGRRYFDLPQRKKRIASALLAADRVILVGEPLRDYFRDLAGRDDHFRVIFNGAIFRDTRRERPALSGGPIEFITVANLHEGKGVDVALSALAIARGKGFEDWNYTIVGDGAERRALTELAASLGVKDKVAFLGARPHREALDLLEKADVFILPSYREAFGIAYLEAMAAGLLAIGVRGQGPETFIDHGKTGILVPPRDVGALAECILDISRRREAMNPIAAAGAEATRTRFTWEAHARHLLSLYEDLAS